MAVYQLLESLGDDVRLSPEPVQLWQLLTLEIAVLDHHGPSLLLKMPYYPDPSVEADFIGAWAPPFIGVPISTRYDLPASAADLRSRFAEAEKHLDALELVNQLVYEIGIDNPRIVERRSFTEIKSSPRTPRIVKAYRIRRFAVMSNLPRSLSNIADYEARKGYVFLPLVDTERFLRRVTLPSGAVHSTYLGLPLMTNVSTVLNDPEKREEIRTSANQIPRELFYRDEIGWILSFDMAGYGRANQLLEATTSNVRDTGTELATFLRVSLAQWFAHFLARVGCRLVQHTGDGFIAAIPDQEIDTDMPGSLPDRVLEAITELYAEVDAVNTRMPTEARLGSRLVLHRGRYRYGRVGGSLSPLAGFDGSEIVNVARLEAGLAGFSRSRSSTATISDPHAPNSLARRHLLAVSEAASPNVSPDEHWTCVAQSQALASKEFVGQATIYVHAW